MIENLNEIIKNHRSEVCCPADCICFEVEDYISEYNRYITGNDTGEVNHSITVTILNEAGYKEAMLGLSLSHERDAETMPPVMCRLYNKDGGHNKFLESMTVWIDVTAPRSFWQQFDSYRIGITKQSGSTMHTLLKKVIVQDDFDFPIWQPLIDRLNYLRCNKNLERLKNELPEGYMQRRIIQTNYKTIRNIIAQRKRHRNKSWRIFCAKLYAQAKHTEFLQDLFVEKDSKNVQNQKKNTNYIANKRKLENSRFKRR